MSCCSPGGYRSVFSGRLAPRDARGYRRHGLRGSARWLRAAPGDRGVDGRSLLEVGGGVGAIQIELLEAGAVRATNVELIDSYEPEAGQLIAEHGLEGKVDRRIGDFVAQAEASPGAEIVILHRVICCYPDVDGMVIAACRRAGETVAITVPRESWWVRLAFASMNGWMRLRRVGFRGYVHPHQRILDVAAGFGFGRQASDTGVVWDSMILGRTAAG